MQRFLDGSDDLAATDHFADISARSRHCWGEGADAAVEFGRFRVLLRQRKLLADGVEIKLGTRAFDLFLALLEADGSLVTKNELFNRVWPGVVVSEENLKTQVSALRKALGEDRDIVRTEVGRGYRLIAAIRRTAGSSSHRRATSRRRVSRRMVSRWTFHPRMHQAVSRASSCTYS
ncbi:MAG: winged helix-turn-helix domain-containing protein [Acetobacteraceae bacterium]|nr:winged helix-turn-helix domain-containing protein [Acetobacteraceae bacterium]